jgi:carbonic anhydrase
MAILSCMDTRLVELLPHAMNMRNGDVKIIKSAGALVAHPFGSIMRRMFIACGSNSTRRVSIQDKIAIFLSGNLDVWYFSL